MWRPFRIPGGWLFISLAVLAPMSLSAIVLITSLSGEGSDPRQVLLVAGIAVTGVIIYLVRRNHARRDLAEDAEPSNLTA